MRYFKDQWSSGFVILSDEDKWDVEEMRVNPAYKEVSEKEYKELQKEKVKAEQ